MKKWLRRMGFGFLLLIAVVGGAIFLNERDTQVFVKRVKNEELPVIKSDWPGNGVDQRDRFINDEFPFLPKTSDLLRWRLGTNPFEEEKRNDGARLEVRDPSDFLAGDDDGLLWLGHATFFIRVNGVSILTDPVFGEPTFLNRLVPVPSPLDNIRELDYVLLSHDHRDHMDEATLLLLAQKFPNAKFLAGLRSEDVLNEWKTPSNKVDTAGWFQKFETGGDGVNIYFLPVRHWSRRFLFDTNWRLWGGFVIESDQTTVYFGGDSGYGRHYREAGELFPKIDYFLIGIGAYEPRWFMKANHNSPADAIQAFLGSGAKMMIPMHYATFDLSDEPPSQPLSHLLTEAEKAGVRERIRPLVINESIAIH